ncbi:MAG: hypothetical protein WCA23_25215 [Stellaceae bacterium]
MHRLHNLRYSLLSQGNLVHQGARHWDHLEFLCRSMLVLRFVRSILPTHAITNPGKLPPVTGDQSQLKVAHEILYHPCASCGRPIIPIPEAALEQVYGGALTDLELEQQRRARVPA